MNALSSLFSEEEKIARAVRQISTGILELDDFVLARGPLELAKAEVSGKRIRRACDEINEEIHLAKKQVGILMSSSKEVKLKGRKRFLHEVEDTLALLHGDVETIGELAESFYRADDRKVLFENLNHQYGELMRHVMSLLSDQALLGRAA